MSGPSGPLSQKVAKKIIQPINESKGGHKSVSIPKKLADEHNLKEGDYVEIVKLDNGN